MSRPRPKATTKRISNRRAFHEGVDRLVETIATSCVPSDHDIKGLRINDFKRLNLILSPADKKKLRKKLSSQQLMSLPSGIL